MVVASYLELNSIGISRSRKRSGVDERIVYQNQILSLMMNKGVNWGNSILIDRLRTRLNILFIFFFYCLPCVDRKAIFNSEYSSGEYCFFNHLIPSPNLKSKNIIRWWQMRHRPQHCAFWMHADCVCVAWCASDFHPSYCSFIPCARHVVFGGNPLKEIFLIFVSRNFVNAGLGRIAHFRFSQLPRNV